MPKPAGKKVVALTRIDAKQVPRGDAFEATAARLVHQFMVEHYGRSQFGLQGEVPVEVAVLAVAGVLRTAADEAAAQIRQRLTEQEKLGQSLYTRNTHLENVLDEIVRVARAGKRGDRA